MRLARTLTIIFFLAGITGPMTGLFVSGAAQYWHEPAVPRPAFGALIGNDPSARKSYATDIVKRSPVRLTAVRWLNWFAYYGLGYIDADAIFSGRSGWLFHQGDFAPNICHDYEYFLSHAQQLDLFNDIANAAGIDFTFFDVPSKGAIYPEMLANRAYHYWSCHRDNEEMGARALALESPEVFDPTAALHAAKADSGLPVYFATDTHWTEFGFATGVRALLAHLVGAPENAIPEAVIGSEYPKSTNLRNALLLRGQLEPTLAVSVDPIAAFVTRSPIHFTKIVHDSYFGLWIDDAHKIFPGNYADMNFISNVAVAPGDRVLFESVESSFCCAPIFFS